MKKVVTCESLPLALRRNGTNSNDGPGSLGRSQVSSRQGNRSHFEED